MGFFDRIMRAGDAARFSEQISPRGVSWLLDNASDFHREIFQFCEPGVAVGGFGSAMFIPHLLGEFKDARLGIVYGVGRGHAFLRTKHLRTVAARHGHAIEDAAALARAFVAEGYSIKRVEYVSFE